MIKNILHLGDASVYCDFGPVVNELVNSRVLSYFIKIKELQKQKIIICIINLTLSYPLYKNLDFGIGFKIQNEYYVVDPLTLYIFDSKLIYKL